MKTVLYFLVLRFRDSRISLVSSIIIAGAPLLLKGILLVPIPFVAPAVAFGLTIYLCALYSEAELFPDVIVIVSGVEIFSTLIIAYLL